MLTILDCHNFWSRSGGGVRRYTLSKIDWMKGRADLRYVFAQPDASSYSEKVADNVTIEHVDAPAPPGAKGEYRMLINPARLRDIIRRHQPDVIEVGSWYWLPQMIRGITRTMAKRPAIVGFWHADFPRAYLRRHGGAVHPTLGHWGERLGWAWARHGYGRLDGIFVASKGVAAELEAHGLDRLCHTPLGVDVETFHPSKRSQALREQVQGGDPERPVILFAHRFQEEKGLTTLMEAYPQLCKEREAKGLLAPALVFAGAGPGEDAVKEMATKEPHVHFLGYLSGQEEVAAWFASCDLFVALSPFETFGLSLAEAMASGVAIVASNRGAAAELVEDNDCGQTVPYRDTPALVDALARTLTRWVDEPLGERARLGVQDMTWSRTFETEVEFYRQIHRRKELGQPLPPGLQRLAAHGSPSAVQRHP